MPSNNINKWTCPPSISQNHTQTKTIYDTIFLIIYAILALNFLFYFLSQPLLIPLKLVWANNGLGSGEQNIAEDEKNVDATK